MTAAESYAALGLCPGAGERAVRRAFRRLVLALHPDRQVGPADGGALVRVVAAYHVALADARGLPPPPFAAPVAPRPRLRFVCARCDDSFELEGECPRCDLALHDELASPVTRVEDARVAPFVTDLELRGIPEPTLLERHAHVIASWGLVGAGTFALFFYTPVATMFLGYGLVLMAMRAVRERQPLGV